MKVLKDFYCIQEKKSYKEGDEYTGKRKDLGALLTPEIKKATKEQDEKHEEMLSHSREQEKKTKELKRKPKSKK